MIKDLPDEIQEAVKTLCTTVYNNGFRVGAYSISSRILTLLRSESNPAKAKAKTINFIRSNNDIKKEETKDNEISD